MAAFVRGGAHHNRAGLRIEKRIGADVGKFFDLGGHFIFKGGDGVNTRGLPYTHLG